MAKKSLLNAIILGAGLALAGRGYAQNSDALPAPNLPAESVSTSSDSFYKRSGDFMLVSDYMHDLNAEQETPVESLIEGGNVTSVYAVDPVIGLQSRIDFLNSDEGRSFYKEEERQLLIGRYQDFIANVSKEKRTANYSKSLEQLSLAAKDGIISPAEIAGVENGTYMLVKEGIDYKVGKYTALALVKLNKVMPEAITRPKPKDKNAPVLPLPELDLEAAEVIETKEEPVIDVPQLTEGKKSLWALTLGANSNIKFDNYGANVGFRAYPFVNKKIGLGLVGELNLGLDKVLDSYSEELPYGKMANGTITEQNIFSAGLAGELQLSWFLLGGGARFGSSVTTTDESILRDDEVLKSNSNSALNSKVSGNVYAGLEIPIKDFGLDALVGYDFTDGLFFGIKSKIPLKK